MDVNDRRAPCGDDVAPYALGALEPEQARAFERHLTECQLCQTDLAALAPAVEALRHTPDPVEPPPELRRRLMSVVEQEAAERRRAGSRAGERPRGPSWLRRPLPVLAAACVALVVGIAIGIGVMSGGNGPAVLAPAHPPEGVQAELHVADHGSRLVVHGMPQLPAGRVMQVWLVRGKNGKPEPTDALFTPRRDGAASVAVPGDMDGVTRVLVSEEPRGGSRSPTTTPSLDFQVQNT